MQQTPRGVVRKSARACLTVLVSAGFLTVSLAATPSPPATAEQTRPVSSSAGLPLPTPGNPLAGRPWGVYQGNADHAWEAYQRSDGDERALLAKIALRPKVHWFGGWIRPEDVAARFGRYLESSTGGDPETLAQMAIFRMHPWEGEACHSLPTREDVVSYKLWIRKAAEAIGDAHVALVLQPDGPFALCAPGGSKKPSHLIRYAARRFSALENTSVYIDAGAADWLRADPKKALKILLPAGIEVTRGFALASTHYDSTRAEVEFGTAIVHALEERGIPGKHFVVNTAANGQPFKGYKYRGANFNNARTCRDLEQHRCVTLGIPPTTDVANPRWGLPLDVSLHALAYVDGYVWVGRPWLRNQASPFVMKRALAVASTTPY